MGIDKQRIAAVEALQRLGYIWDGTAWTHPRAAHASPAGGLQAAADMMHGVLMDRAEALAGCVEDGAEETELAAIGEAIEAYESVRWPTGRVEPPQR